MTKEQFAQLVLDSTDSLYRVSKGILRIDSDCEDAVWEAVSIGFAKLPTLREDKYAKTWLTRILIYECYRVLRERKYQADVPAGVESLSDRQWDTDIGNTNITAYGDGRILHPDTTASEWEVSASGKYSELYEALMILDEKYRVPIELFYLEGYSVREIADILQSTENTVKSWLSRGRSRLKKILEEG